MPKVLNFDYKKLGYLENPPRGSSQLRSLLAIYLFHRGWIEPQEPLLQILKRNDEKFVEEDQHLFQ